MVMVRRSLIHPDQSPHCSPGQLMVTSPDTKTVIIRVRKLAFYFRLLVGLVGEEFGCAHRQSANIFDKIN